MRPETMALPTVTFTTGFKRPGRRDQLRQLRRGSPSPCYKASLAARASMAEIKITAPMTTMMTTRIKIHFHQTAA